MSIVKRSNLFPSSSFFDDFLMRDLFDWSGWANEGGSVPRANILETNDDYNIVDVQNTELQVGHYGEMAAGQKMVLFSADRDMIT